MSGQPSVPVVRDATPADDDAVVAVHSRVYPHRLLSAGALARDREDRKADGHRVFVSEVDGRVAATAWVRLNRWTSEDGAVVFGVAVLPEYRRRGLGSALLQRIEAYRARVGGVLLTTDAIEAEGVAYAERRGFTAGRSSQIARCDLTRLPGPLPAPAGVRVVPLSEVEDLRAVYATDLVAVADKPGIVLPPYETWLEYMRDPLIDATASMVAFAGSTVVALAYLQRVDTRVSSPFTGTHPEHRGRGYATLVKSAGLHAAVRAGALTAYTGTDEENAPMRAVNRRLGYEAYVDQRLYRRVG